METTVDIQGAMGRVLLRFKETVLTGYAAEAEQTAKMNAPWTDQTGMARRMLKGKVIDDGNSLGIELAHRVEYGPALELNNDGKYAILKPTIEGMRQRVLTAIRTYFGDRK